MLHNPSRVLIGILAVLLLSAVALASDNTANAPAVKTEAANAAATTNTPNPTPAAGVNPVGDPLLRLLVAKGVLSAGEVNELGGVPAPELRDRLLLLLKDKGVLTAEDLNSLKAPAAVVTSMNATMSPSVALRVDGTTDLASAQGGGPSVIPAVTPVRVLQVDPPRKEGVIPVLSIGKNIHIQPYGFVKVSGVYDTSSPYGNDFPLPGFNPITNGPDNLAEFHLKARSTRVGSNFEWSDASPNVVVTGKFEVDLEGNFVRANNRNISSIRSNVPSIRLAWGRVDWHTSDKTTLYLLAGQDWTPFGSSTLPNLFETTGLGVGFGTLYERNPQFRFGINQKLGGSRNWSIQPEFAAVLPAYGNLPADLTTLVTPATGTTPVAVPVPNNLGIANQLGYGERQGNDSGRPEIQARFVIQWQLDKAPAVAPAQIILSGVNGERDVVVLANQVPLAPAPLTANTFQVAFPTGARISSNRDAWTGEIQLPTRWFTLIGKYYNGSDLRYYFAGQIYSEFNDTIGMTSTATAQSIDGSSTVVFGTRAGLPVIASQRPARSQGGFVNLGLPLSRLANADPNGRNAGWVLYLHYGYDQVLARDVRRLSPAGGREKGDVGAGTLQYKLNNFVSFIVEESLYRTRALPSTTTGVFPLFAGRPMREWKDFRSEFGPLFTF